MRTRVIPAQITTVEDKIVGSLNLMQMIILMAPVFFTTLAYTLLPPAMSFVGYKLVISTVIFMTCITLSMRIKGKVVVHWLAILFRYNLRSKYYVYNKNETHLRTLHLPAIKKMPITKNKQVKAKTNTRATPLVHHVKSLVGLEKIIHDEQLDFRYKIGKKGGLNVAFEQIKK